MMNQTMQQSLQQQNMNQPTNQANMNVNNFPLTRNPEFLAQQRVRGKKRKDIVPLLPLLTLTLLVALT